MKAAASLSGIYTPSRFSPHRKVEKVSAPSCLHGENAERGSSSRMNAKTARMARLSHSGTQIVNGAAPNGMPAGFVAQILGQVLSTNRADMRSAARAYTDPQRRGKTRFIRWA
jgi:hypothetical protein